VNKTFIKLPPVGETGCCVEYQDAGGVAVDAAHAYWISGGGGIGRANIDGTGASQNFIPWGGITTSPSDLAVDAAHLYWGEEDPNDPSRGTIGRARLDGTDVNHRFITRAARSSRVAVDDAHVYWTSFDKGAYTIARANLDGTGVNHGFLTPPEGVCGVAVDASHVYWTSGFGPIGRANLDGTGADPSFIPAPADRCDLAVDDGHIYWAGGLSGWVGRANLDGTDVDPNFIRGESPFVVAVDPLRSFGFDRLKTNKRKGTAKLTVNVPAAGDLKLAKTKGVKGAEELAAAAGNVALSIRPRGKVKKKLEQTTTDKNKRKRAHGVS
jgi:hypothetical protein